MGINDVKVALLFGTKDDHLGDARADVGGQGGGRFGRVSASPSRRENDLGPALWFYWRGSSRWGSACCRRVAVAV